MTLSGPQGTILTLPFFRRLLCGLCSDRTRFLKRGLIADYYEIHIYLPCLSAQVTLGLCLPAEATYPV